MIYTVMYMSDRLLTQANPDLHLPPPPELRRKERGDSRGGKGGNEGEGRKEGGEARPYHQTDEARGGLRVRNRSLRGAQCEGALGSAEVVLCHGARLCAGAYTRPHVALT
jgi:hypothetical protein